MASSLFNTQTQNNSPMLNPQVRQIVDIVNQSGMSARDLFYHKAKEMGIADPGEYLRQSGLNPNNV